MQPAPQAPREALLALWRHEDALARRLRLGATIVSFGTIATLLTLLLIVGRSNIALVLMTVFSIYTRASSIFVHLAFRLPPFFLRLDDPDPSTREAAVELAREHRSALRPLLVDNLLPSDDEAIASLSDDRLAELAKLAEQPKWRAFGRKWLVAWVVVFTTGLVTLIVTRGGETLAERVID